MERETNFSGASLRDFTRSYKTLLKDRRLHEGFGACVWGIISSGSCKVSQIAASNPLTAGVNHSERRLRRLVHGANKRAEVSAEALGEVFSKEGAKRLKGEHEVLLVIDESDLRKPFARELEHLDTVRDLAGQYQGSIHSPCSALVRAACEHLYTRAVFLPVLLALGASTTKPAKQSSRCHGH